MPEQQNIEYKSSWHDDYLKWICGFANAQGGQICIGKDDEGKVVKGRITNSEYQQQNATSERTASREISELVKAQILEQAGSFGAGSTYRIITP